MSLACIIISVSISVSTRACHARKRGSIPDRELYFLLSQPRLHSFPDCKSGFALAFSDMFPFWRLALDWHSSACQPLFFDLRVGRETFYFIPELDVFYSRILSFYYIRILLGCPLFLLVA